MGSLGTHPAVFVTMASKGLTEYVTWKSAQGDEKKGPKKCACGLVARPGTNREIGAPELRVPAPSPVFFVSVASKGVSFGVSLLFAILAEGFTCVASKGVMGADCWRESNGLGWRDLGEVRRTTWRAPIGGMARRDRADYIIEYGI